MMIVEFEENFWTQKDNVSVAKSKFKTYLKVWNLGLIVLNMSHHLICTRCHKNVKENLFC